jgi:hypothetical protein
LVCASGVATIGCGRKSLTGEEPGSVVVALTLPGGGIVSAVNYTISGNGITPVMGTIDVSAPETTRATALVSGLLPATYSVTMTAVVTSSTLTCTGSGPFTVVAGQTAMVDVILQCKGGAPAAGSIAINGRLDQCPVLTSISATSLQAPVGAAITIGAVALELDPGDTVTYFWTTSAPIGTFVPASAATTTFRCTGVGATQISIAITDGICGDTQLNAIPIVCTGVAGPGSGGNSGGGGTNGGLSCIETSPPPALAATCMTCLSANALPATDGCCPLAATDPTGFTLCQAASACMRSGTVPPSAENPDGHCNIGGDVTPCYCGTHASTCDEPGGPNGPCIAPITAAAAYNLATRTTDAPNESQVISRQGDVTFAFGRAAAVNTVASYLCPMQCGL